MRHVRLSQRAARDLSRLPGREAQRVRDCLDALGAATPRENLDVKHLAGRAPWRRLRVGDYRVLYRPLTDEERVQLRLSTDETLSLGILVARIVHRRDLDAAVAKLTKS